MELAQYYIQWLVMVLAVLKFLVIRVILKITLLGFLFVFSSIAHIIYTETSLVV